MEARLSESVRGMLDGLSPDPKTALYLKEYEGMTQRDLAAELGISVSGAKSRVQRVRARLKALLLDCCYFELDRQGNVVNTTTAGDTSPTFRLGTPQTVLPDKNTRSTKT
jgi:RNA polymerase sigma-70 factor, ECF subfamily